MDSFGDKVLDLFYPKSVACCICGREARLDARRVCAECAEKLPFYSGSACMDGLDGFTAGLYFDDVTSGAIHRLKYSDCTYLGEFFAQFIEIPKEWRADAIVPVPLHFIKHFMRGYNQSMCIAKFVSINSGIPIDVKLLRRTRYTVTQTKLGSAERAKNIKGAFAADKRAKGKRVILIDDVKTTGGTLVECAAALKIAGADAVFAATACARETKKK